MYLFETEKESANGDGIIRSLVVFCPDETPSVEEIGLSIQDFIRLHSIPSRIQFVGFEFNRDALAAALSADAIQDRLPPLLRLPSVALEHYCISAKGHFYRYKNAFCIGAHIEKAIIRKSGLFRICDSRGVLLDSAETFHYVKPSEAHCKVFLRTTQILIEGAEIDFIATWILPFLGPHITEIWCDTAGINAVAYSVSRLRHLLVPTAKHPRISSFSSYEGLQKSSINASALVLISASMAGGLAREARKKAKLPKRQVLTLFYLQGLRVSGLVLCDLTANQGDKNSPYQSTPDFQAEHCPYCLDHSFPLRMRGEHFLPHEMKVFKRMIKANHAPTWMNEFLRRFHGNDIIRAHHLEGRRGDVHELYIASDRFIHHANIAQQLVKVLLESLPSSTRQIIYLNDSGSEEMALMAAALLAKGGDLVIPLASAGDVIKRPAFYRQEGGTTVVMASCIATGRSITDLSQVLRSVQPNNSVIFFIGLTRMIGKAEADRIKSNITYTGKGEHCSLFEIESISLPDNTIMRASIWTQEIILLKQIRERYFDQAGFPEEALETRIGLIQKAEGNNTGGLRHDLFLNDYHGRSLSLRENFAFVDFDYSAKPLTQAEVFFSVSCVLHQLRNSTDLEVAIRQQEFQRVVLDPQNFNRLSGGIIQASLLRACLPPELDYRADSQLSAEMADFLIEIFQACELARGEAASEFLLALAIGQLHLTVKDARRVIAIAEERYENHAFEYYICRFIRDKIG